MSLVCIESQISVSAYFDLSLKFSSIGSGMAPVASPSLDSPYPALASRPFSRRTDGGLLFLWRRLRLPAFALSLLRTKVRGLRSTGKSL